MPVHTRRHLSTAVFLSSICLIACGGRAINKNAARGLILNSQIEGLTKEDVYIESVSQTGKRDTLVEARLKAAFRFERIKDKWIIREVRVGNRPWEKIDEILSALQMVKVEETRKLLERVAAAIDQFRVRTGSLPQFQDYTMLSDQLNPEYLTPLIRLDAWQHPLAAYRVSAETIRLVSAGPDGKLGSADDVEFTRTYPR